MSDLEKRLLQYKHQKSVLKYNADQEEILNRIANKLINGLQLEIINFIRSNDKAVTAGFNRNSNSQKDIQDYILDKIKYIRQLNACIIEYLFSYLQIIKLTETQRAKLLPKFKAKFEAIIEKKGLEGQFYDALAEQPASVPGRYSQIFTNAINYLEAHQLENINEFLDGLSKISLKTLSGNEARNNATKKTVIEVIKSLDSQSEYLKIIRRSMKEASKLTRGELTGLFSQSMPDIVEYQNSLQTIKQGLNELDSGESLLLQNLAIQEIATFLETPITKQQSKQAIIEDIDIKLKNNLFELMEMIDPTIEKIPSEKQLLDPKNKKNGINAVYNTETPKEYKYKISGKELQLSLDGLETNELYKTLLYKITSDILIPGIDNIDAYIKKIIDNVSRQPGQFVMVNVERSNSWGGARKKTKRQKQKNNKVTQRKNKNRIKVKKHASRKFRAKGKSKKGRKL